MDRRDYYRIEDRVHLVQTPIERHLISDNPYGDQYNLPRQALLVSQLQSIDNDTKELLRQVGDQNRALGSYLRAQDEKIELIAKYLVDDDKTLSDRTTVNLSEGGISFYNGEAAELDSYVHMIMVLFPSYASIATIGTVKACEKVDDQPSIYRIGIEFTVLLEADRKQIVRHIRRRQSLEIREQAHKS